MSFIAVIGLDILLLIHTVFILLIFYVLTALLKYEITMLNELIINYSMKNDTSQCKTTYHRQPDRA